MTKLEGGHGVEVGTMEKDGGDHHGFGVTKMLKPTTHIIHTKFDGVKERGENFVDPPFFSNLRKGLPFRYKYLLGL